MKSLSSLILPVLLLVQAETGLQARPGYPQARTRTHSIRTDIGLSWAFGPGFDKMGNTRANATQPYFSVGGLYNYSPQHRIGVDYSYSRMVREQTGELTALPGGSVEGDVYKDLKTQLNSLSVTGEYELLSLLDQEILCGRLALYAGTGLGFLLGTGKTYTIGIKNEVKADGTGNYIHVTGHNEGHGYLRPFIPLTLSLEYAFLPRWSASLGTGYRFILAGKNPLIPKGQLYLSVGLRYHLSK
jgi:hypothetical protein